MQAHRVLQAHLVMQARRVLQAHRVMQAQRVMQARRVLQEMQQLLKKGRPYKIKANFHDCFFHCHFVIMLVSQYRLVTAETLV